MNATSVPTPVTSILYHVRHETRYDYSAPVAHAHHLLHLSPRETAWQKTLSHRLDIQPVVGNYSEDRDAFGNRVTRIEIARPHRQLQVIGHSQDRLMPRPQPAAQESLAWERVRDDLTYHSRPRTEGTGSGDVSCRVAACAHQECLR
jgi:transglutaminase-like putative cysteine protease